VETSSTVRAARRPALVAVVAVVAVVALVLAILSRDSGPPVIRLGAAGAGAEMATLEDAAQGHAEAQLAYVEYRFVLADGARFDAGEAMAWRLEPPTDLPTSAATLAGQLGIDGAPVETPHGDGSVLVGPDDGSAPSLWVGPSGDWSYSAPSRLARDPCAELTPQELDRARDREVEEDPELRSDAEPDPAAGDGPCEPVPPVGVPDEAEARSAAEAFFGDLELGATPIVTEVWADEWGAWVSGGLPVDGQPTDVFLSVAFGPEAAVTSASGTLARLVEVDRYPTVDAETAVARLVEQHTFHGGVEVLIDPAVDPDSPVEAPAADAGGSRPADATEEATSDGATSEEAISGEATDEDATSEEATIDGEVTILPAPEPLGEPEVVTVTLVEAEQLAMLTWDEDQTVWLLPGVRFTDDQGGSWQVLTVADEYLVTPSDAGDGAVTEPAPEPGAEPGVEEPGAGPEPAPQPLPEPVPPDELDPTEAQAVAAEIVGSSEEDAVATIEAAGLVARVIARDGEELAATDDHRVDRIDLRIEGGVVTEAGVG
jgi:hypothetical protein